MNKNVIIDILNKEAKKMLSDIVREKARKVLSDKTYRSNIKFNTISKFSMNMKIVGHTEKTMIRYNRTIRWMIETFKIEELIMLHRIRTLAFKDYTFKYKGAFIFIRHSVSGESLSLDLNIFSLNKESTKEVYQEIIDISNGKEDEKTVVENPYLIMYKCEGYDGIHTNRMRIPKRHLNSIFSNDIDKIISDVDSFLEKKRVIL